MRGLLEYFKLENISHPATSDLEIGMKLDEKFTKHISSFISNVFENEIVKFHCRTNGIESYVVVNSDTKKLQFTVECENKNYSYIIKNVDDVLLETRKAEVKNTSAFKNTLNEHGELKGWNKTI